MKYIDEVYDIIENEDKNGLRDSFNKLYFAFILCKSMNTHSQLYKN